MNQVLDLDTLSDTIAPGSSGDDEANQPVENFDSLGESVELSDAIHDAATLEELKYPLLLF
jgi:hypothetical protein